MKQLIDLKNQPPADGVQVQKFLRRPKVCEITGLSVSTLYEKIAEGSFPKPIPISKRLVVWLENEIAAWQAARVAERRK